MNKISVAEKRQRFLNSLSRFVLEFDFYSGSVKLNY